MSTEIQYRERKCLAMYVLVSAVSHTDMGVPGHTTCLRTWNVRRRIRLRRKTTCRKYNKNGFINNDISPARCCVFQVGIPAVHHGIKKQNSNSVTNKLQPVDKSTREPVASVPHPKASKRQMRVRCKIVQCQHKLSTGQVVRSRHSKQPNIAIIRTLVWDGDAGCVVHEKLTLRSRQSVSAREHSCFALRCMLAYLFFQDHER